jgi:hypothetical protein
MLWFPPVLAAALQLVPRPVVEPPAPRLEITAFGADARALAAEALIDADAIADLVLVDGGARFELELAGERHELHLELDRAGVVLGASIWWTGASEGLHRYDLGLALPALMDAGTLDAITFDDDVVALVAGRATVPLGGDLTDDLDEVW